MVSTLLAMLLVSSTHGVFEECSEESVSQEIELVLGRRDQRQDKSSDPSVGPKHSIAGVLKKANPSKPRVVVAIGERAAMNGSGSYLII